MPNIHELLEKAIKEYPIGTKYHPVGYDAEDKKSIREVDFRPKIVGGRSIEAGYGYIYTEWDGWAEIIHDTNKELEEARNIIYKDDN